MATSSRDPSHLSALLGEAEPRARGDSGEAGKAVETCGDIDMRIARDGTWFYHGSPITRKPLVQLFATVLRREGDGEFYLVTPVERCAVTVDDAPFVAVEVTPEGRGEDQILTFRTNLDETVTADSEHPIRIAYQPTTGEPAPYILVRDRLEALVARPVYYELVELSVEEREGDNFVYGVWSCGLFFEIGRVPDAAPSP